MTVLDRDQFAELLASVLDRPDDLDTAERRVLARLLDAERVLDGVATMLGRLRDEVGDAIDDLAAPKTEDPASS